jgi:hypothetical protein
MNIFDQGIVPLQALESIPDPYDRLIAIIEAQIEYLKFVQEGTIYKDDKSIRINEHKYEQIKEREKLIEHLKQSADRERKAKS